MARSASRERAQRARLAAGMSAPGLGRFFVALGDIGTLGPGSIEEKSLSSDLATAATSSRLELSPRGTPRASATAKVWRVWQESQAAWPKVEPFSLSATISSSLFRPILWHPPQPFWPSMRSEGL